jgi:hypothetical protein
VSKLDGSRLEAYRFHEREWENYGDLCNAFEWAVPETFNMGRTSAIDGATPKATAGTNTAPTNATRPIGSRCSQKPRRASGEPTRSASYAPPRTG